ncbi:serine hydrolase [Marvinbryantia formatexigens]|nr:serine hydrolase [Marvinbryantia formatexigens]
MMERWEGQLCHVHGYIILRNGNTVAEAYRYPYTRESRRILHSVSKTITAIAIGMAVSEGLISVDDKVLSFFPGYEPQQKPDDFLKELTIAHLLTMSVGHPGDDLNSIYAENRPVWKTFLDTEMVCRPGSRFVYNSGATYMLSKILTMVTGEKLLDYLQPRLFEPLGITDVDWDEIDGASTGGWGCMLSLPDMAKIGQLLLQKGSWDGQQLLPETWVEEMTGWKIASDETNVLADWRCGYCYQMWRCSREGCFRADGAFGQYILVMPPKKMVAVIWSEDAYSQDMLDCFWEEVYDKADDRIYGIDGRVYEVFHKKCREWAAPLRLAPSCSFKETQISDKTYQSVRMGAFIDSMSFSFSQEGYLKITMGKGEKVSEIYAGNTEMYLGEGKMNFEIASYIRLGKKRLEPAKYGAVYQWISDRALKIMINWLETPHNMEITCVFGETCVTAVLSVSYRKLLLEFDDSASIFNVDECFVGEIL